MVIIWMMICDPRVPDIVELAVIVRMLFIDSGFDFTEVGIVFSTPWRSLILRLIGGKG